MKLDIAKEAKELRRMKVKELRSKYLEVFGEEIRSYHKEYLLKKIALRMGSLGKGSVGEGTPSC